MVAIGLWLRTADLRRRQPAALVEGPVDLLQVAEGFVFVYRGSLIHGFVKF